MENSTLDELAAAVRTARMKVERTKALKGIGEATYDELADAGKAFAAAWYAYQVAKVGKARAKRLDYRAVIR